MIRSSHQSRVGKRRSLFPRPSSSSAFGKASWPPLTGVPALTRLRTSLCAKSGYVLPFITLASLSHIYCAHQKFAPILEPFCNGPKTEVALINVVQVYCYEDTRIIKAFPQILKVCLHHTHVFRHTLKFTCFQVLYNQDCISDQAIIYWHQKGSKPQGRQHFLKNTEPLVKVGVDCACQLGLTLTYLDS